MVSTEAVLSGVLSVSLLVFLAKILAGLFSKIGVPAVIGELSAGIIFGPHALGGLIIIFDHKIIELSESRMIKRSFSRNQRITACRSIKASYVRLKKQGSKTRKELQSGKNIDIRSISTA